MIKKDVDTGTNLVCEDSRLNIRNGTPSQLIFHSHESGNREIETNIPVDKNQIKKPVLSVFTVGFVWPYDDIKVLCTFSCPQSSLRLNPNGLHSNSGKSNSVFHM